MIDIANGFKGVEMEQVSEKWNIKPCYRAAYQLGGNGIIERNHSRIKAMALHCHTHPVEATYWYNMSPRDRQKEETVPPRSVYVRMGYEVWVKPPNARFTSQ